MHTDLIDAIEALAESVARLRDWVSDHTPGQDHSSLEDVGDYLHQCDEHIQMAKQKLEL